MASPPPSPTPSEASSHFEGFGIDDDLFAVEDYGAQAEELATNGPNAPHLLIEMDKLRTWRQEENEWQEGQTSVSA